METNQTELSKLTKSELIELIQGYEEKLKNMDECRNLLRIDSRSF